MELQNGAEVKDFYRNYKENKRARMGGRRKGKEMERGRGGLG